MSAPCPVFGFIITVARQPHTGDAEIEALTNDLMALLAANDLVGSARGDRTLTIIVRRDGSQATDQDRLLVQDWSTRWSDDASVSIGPIVDLGPSA